MKVTLIALLLLSITMSAQKNRHVTTSGTNFIAPVSDKKWNNHNGENFTAANFKDYSGESFVRLRTDQTVQLTLSFEMVTRQGDLNLVFSSDKENREFATLSTPFDRNFVNEGKVTVTLEPGKEYRLRLIGKNAKGFFKCKWEETTSGMVMQ